MNRTLPDISQKARRYFLVFAAMVFVLLLACPVKSSIKNFAGLPVKTEQGVGKGNLIFFGNNSEQCVNSETAETLISQTVSVDTNNLLREG